MPVELSSEYPPNVTPPVVSAPAPVEFDIVPPLIVTALGTVAPLLISSVFAPTAMVPVPAAPLAPLIANVPALIVVPPL